MSKIVIYDFGSNNGDDIPYYLKKSELVVAIEANPVLCDSIKKRFQKEIDAGIVCLENCVLTTDEHSGLVNFYLHKHNHVLSQFPKPDNIHDFEEVSLPARSVKSIIDQYGDPHYIKIDIEHYDANILRCLFRNKIKPPFISAESHSIEIFSLMVADGGYNSFKLVDGQSVSKKYSNHQIKTFGEIDFYSFPYHSAGPFGDDIDGDWMTADNFFSFLAFEGLGWKDIHATNIHEGNKNIKITLFRYIKSKHFLKRLLRLQGRLFLYVFYRFKKIFRYMAKSG